jgi:hypothetical protein
MRRKLMICKEIIDARLAAPGAFALKAKGAKLKVEGISTAR